MNFKTFLVVVSTVCVAFAVAFPLATGLIATFPVAIAALLFCVCGLVAGLRIGTLRSLQRLDSNWAGVFVCCTTGIGVAFGWGAASLFTALSSMQFVVPALVASILCSISSLTLYIVSSIPQQTSH